MRRFHRVLSWVDQVFKEYAGRFNGKQSPVHLFWHSFDLASLDTVRSFVEGLDPDETYALVASEL